jgi:hypothetical protein
VLLGAHGDVDAAAPEAKPFLFQEHGISSQSSMVNIPTLKLSPVLNLHYSDEHKV